MSEPRAAIPIEAVQAVLAPLFPGLIGVRLVEVTPERVVATLAVRDDLCTTGATLHGGAFMAFADTIGAVATFVNLPPNARTTTIESSTKFLRGAPAGSTVTAECTPFHKGRTTMVWQTQIRSAEGKLCAVVTQTQLVIAG
ncbi:MAG: PaaI family thioesterase [Caldimonas sp.]